MFSKLGTPCHSAVEAMVGTEGAVAAKDMQCHPPQPMGKVRRQRTAWGTQQELALRQGHYGI